MLKKKQRLIIMVSEENVKKKLADWLILNDFTVYWEKKNNYNFPIFKTKGINKKPDLLIINNKCKNCVALIEVKTANTDDNLRSSKKIINYYNDYSLDLIKYYINNIEIKPKYFLVASPYSIDGHLYKNEKIMSLKEHHNDYLINNKTYPKYEYIQTYEYIRNIWNSFKSLNYRDKKYSIGILVSSKLINLNEIITTPAFYFQFYSKNKDRWLQYYRTEFNKLINW